MYIYYIILYILYIYNYYRYINQYYELLIATILFCKIDSANLNSTRFIILLIILMHHY